MDEKNPEELGIKVEDGVKVGEIFGKMSQKMAGIGGTLHITDEAGLQAVPKVAWDLAGATKKPVIIVVRRT